jgi:hypothetical protein
MRARRRHRRLYLGLIRLCGPLDQTILPSVARTFAAPPWRQQPDPFDERLVPAQWRALRRRGSPPAVATRRSCGRTGAAGVGNLVIIIISQV